MTRKKNTLFWVHRKFFSKEEQEDFLFHAVWTDYRACPRWLGNFEFSVYGGHYDKKKQVLPARVSALTSRMAALVPKQEFNTTFIQKYEKGQGVKLHRDPKSNRGYTVVAIFGRFKGGSTVLENNRFCLEPGDVLVQRCLVDGKPRPLHRVTAVTEGTRYALILNTVK